MSHSKKITITKLLYSIIKPIRYSILGLTITLGTFSFTVMPTIAEAIVTAPDFSELVSEVVPAVARVNVTKKISEQELEKAQTATILRNFFGDKVDIPESATIPAVEYSNGTAFFITKDGYMLTNHHVIEGAETITVTLNDRRELDAKVIGSDERSDIAVLKVTADNLPALSIGDSESLKVGEPVLAIGSPFGFDYSASAGIVSAKSRNVSREATVPFIQTDVALNPGNSGGPLFNQDGKVIGINSRIFSATGGYMGLSFSIPIDEAMEIYQQLRENGKISRAYIGLYTQDIDRNLAEALGLDKPKGALLARVIKKSPADKAGLKAGDIVLEYNGNSIKDVGDLANRFNRALPKDSFKLLIQRKGKEIIAQGQFDNVPNDVKIEQSNGKKSGVNLGLRLRELTPESIERLSSDFTVSGGVVITLVNPTGLAGRSGMQAGDIITKINQHTVTDVGSFKKAHNSLPSEGVVMIELIRRGVPIIIGLRIK